MIGSVYVYNDGSDFYYYCGLYSFYSGFVG